ncbi:MAG TPA: fused MFS/spermidine synthase [Bryobacteraceae bacterium]|nr:fused MFS/spermidine synthase [Bryobacteraceae bacterium]
MEDYNHPVRLALVALYALTVFLSAFLLFQVQPMIAKMILPWFGGSSTVWSTCMLFFQTALLLGYLYAHGLRRWLGARTQAVCHGVLLAGSLAVLPVIPATWWRNGWEGNPSWKILGLLAATVGLPYFLLSATSPLLQWWYARTHAGAVPYRLFALSNLASLAALLSYPVLVEPNLSTRRQAIVWSVAYACFAILCGVAGWLSARRKAEGPASGEAAGESAPKPSVWDRLFWVALAFCASTLLLAMTNQLTHDVAAVPFLWILPLSAYLLTFVLCFEAPRIYWRPGFYALLIPAFGVSTWMLRKGSAGLDVIPAVSVVVSALFVFCMVCHGELARAKPHPRHLTEYYVMVSLGGAAGGVFVGLVAPSLFNGYYELPIGLVLCALMAVIVLFVEYRRFLETRFGMVCALALTVALGTNSGIVIVGVQATLRTYRIAKRNFYGTLRVREFDNNDGYGVRRELVHGGISHGEEALFAPYRQMPGTYYCPETGAGRVLTAGQNKGARRIALVGLGPGALVAYGKESDTIRIYEINPLVVQLANDEFFYLRDTPARVETVFGDARLSLEREPDQNFDVLAIDAFSSDSIPVHLLTREAFAIYLRHLKPGGVLAIHISNRYVDLRPVTERAARQFGRVALLFDYHAPKDDPLCFSASWVLIVDDVARKTFSEALSVGKPIKPYPRFRLWTDDFSNLYSVLD